MHKVRGFFVQFIPLFPSAFFSFQAKLEIFLTESTWNQTQTSWVRVKLIWEYKGNIQTFRFDTQSWFYVWCVQIKEAWLSVQTLRWWWLFSAGLFFVLFSKLSFQLRPLTKTQLETWAAQTYCASFVTLSRHTHTHTRTVAADTIDS